MKIVIIGLGVGGMFSAIAARKKDKDAEIVMIDRKDFEILHTCGLPYHIEGRITSEEHLKGRMPDVGADKLLSHEVIKILPDEKKVIARPLDGGAEIEIVYDRLIISSGAKAFVPPIDGIDKNHVFKIDSHDDAVRINRFLEKEKPKRAVIAGAGAIGLETAVALHGRGLDVTVVEMMEHAMPKALDPDMAKLIPESMSAGFMFGSKLEKIDEGSVVIDGDNKDADIAVIAAGCRGEVGFLEGSGIEMGKFGIKVNEKMETNIENIYAIGDIVELRSLIDGKPTAMQLASAAYKHGMVAGTNAAGGERKYPGPLHTFVTRLGSLEVASTGMRSGDGTAFGKARGPVRPDWCEGHGELTVKIIVDKASRKIVGCQAVGTDGAGHRIDIAANAIHAGMIIDDLVDTEMSYCPANSDVYDVLMQAADNAIRRLEKT